MESESSFYEVTGDTGLLYLNVTVAKGPCNKNALFYKPFQHLSLKNASTVELFRLYFCNAAFMHSTVHAVVWLITLRYCVKILEPIIMLAALECSPGTLIFVIPNLEQMFLRKRIGVEWKELWKIIVLYNDAIVRYERYKLVAEFV